MHRYRDLFLDESRKHIETAEALLLAEASPGPAAADAVFREIHSLKGMAGSMGYSSMAELAHRLEDLLGRWRATREALGSREVDLSLRTCDRLRDLREEVAGGGTDTADWSDLAADFAALGASASSVRGGLRARITFSPDCASPAARAYLILRRFKELDPELTSVPTEDEILLGRGVRELELRLNGPNRSDVEAVFDTLTEVESLSFGDPQEAPELRSPAVDVAPPLPIKVEFEGETDPDPEMDPRVRMPESVQTPVRVLDEFVDLVGEMTISRSHLEDAARAAGSELLRDEVNRLGGLIRSLHERVMALRMLPFSLVTGGLKRLVRDLASRLGKEVEIRVAGEDIGMDKSILLQISDPLVHLLRNALDHGLESPEERQRMGKPPRGLIELRAERAKTRVEVTMTDDGRGIDVEAVRRKAVEVGIYSEEESRSLPSRDVLACLFRPGFSTRDAVSDLSGRGVGLDVVRTKVVALGGSIELASAPGAGAEFRLSLPLSVAIVPVLMVAVGASNLALPVTSVVRTVEALPRDVRKKDGEHVLLTEHGQVPILSLARIIRSEGKRRFDRMPLVLLQTPGGITALAVDRFIREEDLFIKPVKGPLHDLPGLSGYSVLGDGSLVFLLDPTTLLGS